MSRDQEKFYTVYRGKHSRWRHRSYMRLGKVYAARRVLERSGVALRGISVFDYGFGPGSFFLTCEKDCTLSGLELDGENVKAVRRMLAERGYRKVNLDVVEPGKWEQHPLLDLSYDLVVMSHVLEHLDDPVGTLRRVWSCVAEGGMVLGLVPLNEIIPDENHKWECNRELVEAWAEEAGYEIADYVEVDHSVYYTLPIYQARGRVGRLVAQAFGLGMGLLASCMTPRRWFSLGEKAGALIGTKPTQAAFLLRASVRNENEHNDYRGEGGVRGVEYTTEEHNSSFGDH